MFITNSSLWSPIGSTPADFSSTLQSVGGYLQPLGGVTLAVALVLLCAAAWGLNLFGLPGNWIGVAAVALYAWLGPESGRIAVGGVVVAAVFAIALLGEVVELIAGAAGASRAGASRRATLYSIGGSMIGALAGAFIGIPVPIIGSVLAAVLFGGLGATAGAIYAEWTDGRAWRESWTIGKAAFVGRTLGTLGKSAVGVLIVIVALIAVCV